MKGGGELISVKSNGDFSKTKSFLKQARDLKLSALNRFGREGVDALMLATPKDTGETATSWYYRIIEKKDETVIEWCNRHVEDGVPIAIILQYGHATRGGGYVEGIDYINPAMRPLFERMANEAWKEVVGG